MDNVKFTGMKDVDLMIMDRIEDDKTLLDFCSINKYANNLCNDEIFWKKRTLKKYPKYLIYADIDNWKTYYIWLTTHLNAPNKGEVFLNSLKQNKKDISLNMLDKYPEAILEWLDNKKNKKKLSFNHKKYKDIKLNIFGKAFYFTVIDGNSKILSKFLKKHPRPDNVLDILKLAILEDFIFEEYKEVKKFINL